MAALTKSKRSESDILNPDNPSLPENILDHLILPCLPFKTLKRFQCVSRKYRSLIGHDPLFPSDQASLLSPSSADLVHLSRNGLSFLISPESIGVPDPSLEFLGNLSENLRLLCSTNGLLLFCGSYEDSEESLCLCNPATREKLFVPTPHRYIYLGDVGLAFDPSITPSQFKLVALQFDDANDGRGYAYGFDIFRSDTGWWSKSNKRVGGLGTNVPDPSFGFHPQCQKRVHVQGVVYWHFPKYILWYNTEEDLAGSVPLPPTRGFWCMGVYAGGVVCYCSYTSGVEVWRLMNGTHCHWDRLHCISWDSIPLQLNATWLKRSRGKRRPIRRYKSQLFRPLAFDGQFVYLLDFMNQGAFTEMGTYTLIVGYNICTKQLENKGGIFIRGFLDEQAHDYHNSMAPLPTILG